MYAWDASEKGMIEKLVVAEHAWENHHLIQWGETLLLHHNRRWKLLVKGALHIQMTPRRNDSTKMKDSKSLFAGL